MRSHAIVAALAVCSVAMLSACSSDSSDLTGIPDGPILSVAVIAIVPTSARLVVGSSISVAATPIDANGNAMTNRRVAWSSSDPSVATVSSNGEVRAVKAGAAAIVASSDLHFGVSDVTVTAVPVASVSISPTSTALSVGASTTLSVAVSDAGGQPLTGRLVTWSSSNASIATVSQAGVVTALAGGVTEIVAMSEGMGDTATVTVTPVPVASVSITPATLQLTRGQTAQLTMSARDASGNILTNRNGTWSTSDAQIASVSPSGMVTGLAAGSATITVIVDGKSATAAVTVTPPPSGAMYVTPATVTLVAGQTAQLSAVVTDANGNPVVGQSVSWSSSNSGVLTVSGSGLVTAVSPGSATVTATSGTLNATATVTVVPQPVASVTVSPPSASMLTGQTVQLTATPLDASGQPLSGHPILWTSSNTAVATVSSSGLVTAVGAGTAFINAISGGKSGTATITATLPPVATVAISPAITTILLGQTAQLTAVLRDAGGATLTNRPVVWTSSDAAVVTVSSSGFLVTVGVGSATITATSEGKSGTVTITVLLPPVASVAVSPSSRSIAVGASVVLTATARDASGNTLPGVTVNWSVSNAAVATVSATGVVTGVSAGTATVTATAQGKSGSATITVTTTAPPPPPPVPVAAAELPRVYLNTTFVAPGGSTVTVPAGGNVQAALDAVTCGQTVTLAAGATYSGNFILRSRPCQGWIVIRSAGSLPAEGTRMTPTLAATHNLPKIVIPANGGNGGFETERGAHQYRIIGIEVTVAPSVTEINALVRIDGNNPLTTAQYPSQIIIDRSYIHGNATLDLRRCVMFNAPASAVIDSWLADCHSNLGGAQAIVSWDGIGPLKIVNNYLEGSAENVMLGGADPMIPGVIPSDVEIRGNHFYRPPSWKNAWAVKALFEIKSGKRVLLEGNIFDGNWADGQVGHAFNLKSENQSGRGTWNTCQDITFRYNVIRNTGAGWKIVASTGGAGPVTDKSRRFTIHDNLMYAVNVGVFTGVAQMIELLGSGLQDIAIDHNTMVSTGPINTALAMSLGPVPLNALKYTNNIVAHGTYGVKGASTVGTASLNSDVTSWSFLDNVLVAPTVPLSMYPATTLSAANLAAVGFVDAANGDYQLAASSPFQGKGADIARVKQATAGVVVAP